MHWSFGRRLKRRSCPGCLPGWAAQPKEMTLSEKKKYRRWTVQRKLEIVLAGLRGEVSVAEVCREHQISETLFSIRGARSCSRAAQSACRGRRSASSWWSSASGCVTWSAPLRIELREALTGSCL
jgi:Transposase